MESGLISVDQWSDGSQIYFLTHLHSDHTQGLSSKWSKGPLFCSRLTAKLLPFKFPNFKLSLLRVLEIGLWHSISLVSPSSGSRKVIKVMAIDAHHCPGKYSFHLIVWWVARQLFVLSPEGVNSLSNCMIGDFKICLGRKNCCFWYLDYVWILVSF